VVEVERRAGEPPAQERQLLEPLLDALDHRLGACSAGGRRALVDDEPTHDTGGGPGVVHAEEHLVEPSEFLHRDRHPS